MKKIIIVLTVLFTPFLSGVLCGTHDKSDEVHTMTMEQIYKSQYPVQMPDVVLTPMTCFPIF